MRRSAVLVAALLAVGGCGSQPPPSPAPRASVDPPREPPPAPAPKRATVKRAHCSNAAGDCAAVTGRVIYVEAVDPDGDGDAHYVLAGGNVTGPGVTVIDVEPSLRPRRLPRAGELVSAAGPVFTGSFGQRQIQAVELHHQRRRGELR
jgi:hypothetical protein